MILERKLASDEEELDEEEVWKVWMSVVWSVDIRDVSEAN